MTREVTTTLDNILSLVSCAESYGFAKSTLLSALGEMTGYVTDNEIEEFSNWFLTPEAMSQGYSEEDAEEAKDVLTEWRDSYAKETK